MMVLKKLVSSARSIRLRSPFLCLVSIFWARVIHGGGEDGAENLDLGVGVVLALLAMPGTLASLSLFDKYGSLLQYLRGEEALDGYVAAVPDEYFFIVLSMTITGLAAVWWWEAVFPGRRDYANLMPLPIAAGTIFLSNLVFIVLLAGLLAFDVNAISIWLYPIAVFGSQSSFVVLCRFAAGNAVAVVCASVFSFLSVFAIAGMLLAFLPYSLFRRSSLFDRFVLGLLFLAMFVSSLHVSHLLSQLPDRHHQYLGALPSVWFVALSSTLWGRGDHYFHLLATRAIVGTVALLIISISCYAASFRRTFLRISEVGESGPLPRTRIFSFVTSAVDRVLMCPSAEQACFHFVAKTILRSEAHLRVVLGFFALGCAIAGQNLRPLYHGVRETTVSDDIKLLSIPFILSYCVILGIRVAFEVPYDLQANWVFRIWLKPHQQARPIARRILYLFSLSWICPACFIFCGVLWGWQIGLLNTLMVVTCSLVLIEILIVRFRKIPCTCSLPPFRSYSPLMATACLFGLVIFGNYIPALAQWCLQEPGRAILFIPLALLVTGVLSFHRKHMLDMDKELIFDEVSGQGF